MIVYPPRPWYVANVVVSFGAAYEDLLTSLIQIKKTWKVQDDIDAFDLLKPRSHNS